MKARYSIFLLILVSSISCNYLDFDETSGLNTREDTYSYFDNVKQMLTDVYSYMPQDFGVIGGAMREAATDNAEFGNTGGNIQDFNTGNWSAIRVRDSQWRLYNGIRAANEFLESLESVDISRFENDTRYANWVKQLELFPYEARLLRSFYFFDLARRYGDIAMPTAMLTTEEANLIEKTPFHEVIDFIVKECDEVMDMLPVTYVGQPNNETGRVTKGFAMALKSRALLYAASRLHNPAMDTEKWRRSAQAALDIINSGLYSLESGEKVNNVNSKEVVLFRMNNENQNFELNNFPIRFTEGARSTPATATFPTQNLVDAFETINGYPVTLSDNGWICNDPDFDPQRPYNNRDPRFARTVLANGMPFKDSEIETFRGGRDDAPVSEGGSPTGYFLRKYIQESTNFAPDRIVSNQHHWIIYRYAETLLTYAESMVEAFNDPNYSDATFTRSALWALNQVRSNAGMPLISTTSREEFIEKVRNERRVEFAFEDHRFWDIRRWMIGNETQREIYGVSIDKNLNGELLFAQFLYETRAWNDRMNLYPIPQSELFKNKNLNPQNPGW